MLGYFCSRVILGATLSVAALLSIWRWLIATSACPLHSDQTIRAPCVLTDALSLPQPITLYSIEESLSFFLKSYILYMRSFSHMSVCECTYCVYMSWPVEVRGHLSGVCSVLDTLPHSLWTWHPALLGVWSISHPCENAASWGWMDYLLLTVGSISIQHEENRKDF